MTRAAPRLPHRVRTPVGFRWSAWHAVYLEIQALLHVWRQRELETCARSVAPLGPAVASIAPRRPIVAAIDGHADLLDVSTQLQLAQTREHNLAFALLKAPAVQTADIGLKLDTLAKRGEATSAEELEEALRILRSDLRLVAGNRLNCSQSSWR